MENLKKLLDLFLTFLKIGAFTFGGGYAMVPLFSKEFVEKRHLLKDNDILEMIAIAEATPGPIAVNMATFIGYRTAGILGSCIATIGVVLPSFVIIILISFCYDAFMKFKIVKFAFYGIKSGVLALVLKAFVKMYKAEEKKAFDIIIMLLSFVTVAFFAVNPIIVSICAAVLGLLYVNLGKRVFKK